MKFYLLFTIRLFFGPPKSSPYKLFLCLIFIPIISLSITTYPLPLMSRYIFVTSQCIILTSGFFIISFSAMYTIYLKCTVKKSWSLARGNRKPCGQFFHRWLELTAWHINVFSIRQLDRNIFFFWSSTEETQEPEKMKWFLSCQIKLESIAESIIELLKYITYVPEGGICLTHKKSFSLVSWLLKS